MFVKIVGHKTAINKLTKMGRGAVEAHAAMEKIAKLIFEIIEKNFESQGRRGGGQWRPLTEEWVNRKLRLGLDPRINIASSELMESLTKRDAPHQILRVTNKSVELATDLPYISQTQRHRPVNRIMERDKKEMREIVSEHIKGKFERAM